MAYDSTLKKAQEQSKGTIQDYWHTVMALWQYLKESPGAIQRYYPRLLTRQWWHYDSTLKKAQEQSKGTIQDYWHTVMALWQYLKESPGAIQRYYPRLLTRQWWHYDSTLKKAQEQSKGTIQDYCVSVMVLWQYLKESPGAIQRYYPRLLTRQWWHYDSTLKKAQEQSKGTIQDYCVSVMALWQFLKKAQEQSKGTIQDYCVSVMAYDSP